MKLMERVKVTMGVKHSTPSSFLVVECFHSRPPLYAQ